jgi:hypothetical protein
MPPAFLPPSTNEQYRGAPSAAYLLAFVAVGTILPGCVHVFLPDGGAGTIAGLDLGPAAPTIVALFAWAGATQIALGLAMLGVALRYRSLVPPVLALVILERALHAVNGWILKPGSGHHPPEHYAVLATLPVLVLAFVLSIRGGARPSLSK